MLRLRALPNFWCHASADHAVTTRLAPAGVDRTEVVVTWLVDEEAVEGRDYSLDRLLPVWGRTSEQDWLAVRAQPAGYPEQRLSARPALGPARGQRGRFSPLVRRRLGWRARRSKARSSAAVARSQSPSLGAWLTSLMSPSCSTRPRGAP